MHNTVLTLMGCSTLSRQRQFSCLFHIPDKGSFPVCFTFKTKVVSCLFHIQCDIFLNPYPATILHFFGLFPHARTNLVITLPQLTFCNSKLSFPERQGVKETKNSNFIVLRSINVNQTGHQKVSKSTFDIVTQHYGQSSFRKGIFLIDMFEYSIQINQHASIVYIDQICQHCLYLHCSRGSPLAAGNVPSHFCQSPQIQQHHAQRTAWSHSSILPLYIRNVAVMDIAHCAPVCILLKCLDVFEPSRHASSV